MARLIGAQAGEGRRRGAPRATKYRPATGCDEFALGLWPEIYYLKEGTWIAAGWQPCPPRPHGLCRADLTGLGWRTGLRLIWQAIITLRGTA